MKLSEQRSQEYDAVDSKLYNDICNLLNSEIILTDNEVFNLEFGQDTVKRIYLADFAGNMLPHIDIKDSSGDIYHIFLGTDTTTFWDKLQILQILEKRQRIEDQLLDLADLANTLAHDIEND